MFGNWKQKEAEEQHDDLSYASKITKNIENIVNVSNVSDTLIFKHDHSREVLLIMMLCSQLWSTESITNLVKGAHLARPT